LYDEEEEETDPTMATVMKEFILFMKELNLTTVFKTLRKGRKQIKTCKNEGEKSALMMRVFTDILDSENGN